MALVIGLVAAAARAMSSNHDQDQRNDGYNNGYNNGQYGNNQSNGYNGGYNSGYNNGHGSSNYNAAPCAPYAAYAPQMTGSRRAGRRMGRRMRKARDVDMVMSFMSSGSRAGPASTASTVPPSTSMHPQPVGGVSYVRQGDNPRARGMYPPESQGVMAPEPEGYQWRDAQSRDRPVSRGDRYAEGSSESLPTYEQAVRKSGKS